MRIRQLVAITAILGAFALFAGRVHAQTATTGQIVGTVTDPSAALVVGAKVVLMSDAGVRRETQTGPNGRYALPLLDPGVYRIEVAGKGFVPIKLDGINVKITETSVVDVSLKVGGGATTVSVTGESPLVRRKVPPRVRSSMRRRSIRCRCRPATSSNC